MPQVARDTARRAIAMLRDEGLVATVPQRGTYVQGTTRAHDSHHWQLPTTNADQGLDRSEGESRTSAQVGDSPFLLPPEMHENAAEVL
jgi:DNA-binding GntR family transcriptional regulator